MYASSDDHRTFAMAFIPTIPGTDLQQYLAADGASSGEVPVAALSRLRSHLDPGTRLSPPPFACPISPMPVIPLHERSRPGVGPAVHAFAQRHSGDR
jgi:hypothetical protein